MCEANFWLTKKEKWVYLGDKTMETKILYLK